MKCEEFENVLARIPLPHVSQERILTRNCQCTAALPSHVRVRRYSRVGWASITSSHCIAGAERSSVPTGSGSCPNDLFVSDSRSLASKSALIPARATWPPKVLKFLWCPADMSHLSAFGSVNRWLVEGGRLAIMTGSGPCTCARIRVNYRTCRGGRRGDVCTPKSWPPGMSPWWC
jgi:hypothetical protein